MTAPNDNDGREIDEQKTPLPREAREGLMRAWLKILSDRHPDVTWLPVSEPPTSEDPQSSGQASPFELAESA